MSNDTLDLSDFGSEEDLKGYDYPKEGQYHLVVNATDCTREKINGIKFECQVLAGNVKGQNGKTFWETFWDPDPEHKDGGRFMRKRLTSFAMAVGLITPAQLGQGGVLIDWAEAVGRQFVAVVVNYSRKGKEDGRTYEGAEIDGLKIYRVTAPEVEEVPKDKEAFALIVGAAGGNGGDGQQQAPAPAPMQQAEAAPATAGVSGGSKWDNL